MDCVNSLEVLDLPFTDCSFTWTNKMEEEHFVVGKLDKLMVNEYWFVEFEKTKVEFQDGGF